MPWGKSSGVRLPSMLGGRKTGLGGKSGGRKEAGLGRQTGRYDSQQMPRLRLRPWQFGSSGGGGMQDVAALAVRLRIAIL